MSFFLHPLGLLALLGVPAVVLLHAFRRRFRPKTVSAVFLWQLPDRTAVSGRQWERVVRSASFWLEVAAALLLGLLFAGLRLPFSREAEHLVAVLDGSASMGATFATESVRDQAVAELRRRTRALPARSRVTVVESGPRPRVLAGPAAFPAEALEALRAYAPVSPRHDPLPALSLAQQYAPRGAVLFLTDHFQPDDLPAEVEVLSLGRPADNRALTHAVRVPEGDEDEVYLTVSSFSREPAEARLSLGSAEQILAEHRLLLQPGERRHLSLRIPKETPALEVQLDADPLAIDNRALLVAPQRRDVRVMTTLSAELAVYLGLMSSLQAPSRVDRLLGATEATREAPSPEAAHLLIGAQEAGSASTWCLLLQGDEAHPARDLIGPFLAERSHALLDGTTLEGIIWSIDPELALPGRPLVSAGNQPILTEEYREGPFAGVTYHLNFHPRRSSLQRSPDWPILLANLVELRRAALPGPEQRNIVVGESFVYHQFPGPLAVLWHGGERREIRTADTLVLDDLPATGLYELQDSEQRTLCHFAVNFQDPAESDLGSALPGQRASSQGLATTAAGFGGLEIALLALLLALILADWLVLTPRRSPPLPPAASIVPGT